MNVSIRWSLRSAEREFRIDRRTLGKTLRSQGVRAGADGKHSSETIFRIVQQFRPQQWRIRDAAEFFGISGAKLRRRLESSGGRARPGCVYSSTEIANSVYGSLYDAKLRKTRLQGDQLELEIAKTRGQLVKADEVFRVTDSIAAALRWQIELLEIPASDRRHLLREVERLDRDNLRGAGIGDRPEWDSDDSQSFTGSQ